MAYLGGLLAAGAGLAQSIGNWWTSRRNVDKTIKANKELAEYGYSKDLEMWNRGNEYNTPEAQMARLEAAGLNPNMIYGSGSAVGNTSSQLPKYNAPTVKYDYEAPNVIQVLGAYQDLKLKQAQIDNVGAQTANVEMRTANEDLRGVLLKIAESTKDVELRQKIFNLYQSEQLGPGVLQGQSQELEKGQLEIGKGKLDVERKGLENLFLGSTMTDRKRLVSQERALKDAEILFRMYRNQWMKLGITSSDHPVFRGIARMFSEGAFEGEGPSIGPGWKKMGDWFESRFANDPDWKKREAGKRERQGRQKVTGGFEFDER